LWEETCLCGRGVKWHNGTDRPIEPLNHRQMASQTLPPPLVRRGVNNVQHSLVRVYKAQIDGVVVANDFPINSMGVHHDVLYYTTNTLISNV
jgi:hypothetical protein